MIMANSFEEIIGLLPKLSDSELKALRSRVNALLSFSSEAGPAGQVVSLNPPNLEAHFVDEVTDALCKAAGARGHFVERPAVLRASHYNDYARKVRTVVAPFIEHAKISNKTQRLAFVNLSLELLARNLCDLGVPCTAWNLMRHAHRVPHVIELAFPGYAEAGMLSWVVSPEEPKHVRKK